MTDSFLTAAWLISIFCLSVHAVEGNTAHIVMLKGFYFLYDQSIVGSGSGITSDKESDEMKRDENYDKDDIAVIEKLRKTDIEASLKGDTEILLSLMTDDIILIYPDQPPAKGIENIRKRMEAYKKELENITIKQYSITFDELVIEGGLAYEWGSFHHKYFLKDENREIEEKGRLMRILRKQPDGSWKVARSIWNSNLN